MHMEFFGWKKFQAHWFLDSNPVETFLILVNPFKVRLKAILYTYLPTSLSVCLSIYLLSIYQQFTPTTIKCIPHAILSNAVLELAKITQHAVEKHQITHVNL